LGKDQTETKAHAVVDRALAEYAALNARLGRQEVLDPLFQTFNGRPIFG
jgi:hypothetical protein